MYIRKFLFSSVETHACSQQKSGLLELQNKLSAQEQVVHIKSHASKQAKGKHMFLLHTVASMTIYLHTLDAYVKGIMNFVGKREAEAKAEAEEVKHPMLFVCTCYRSVNHTT